MAAVSAAQCRPDGRQAPCPYPRLGVDALTLAATILTVVVIDDDVFDDVFGRTVQFNDEGEVVAVEGGRGADGVPFTAAAIERLLDNEPVAAPGAACLTLAWQHRDGVIS